MRWWVGRRTSVTRVGFGWPRTAATAFLPADGAAAYERVETTRDGKATVSYQVTESARFSGVTGLLSTDSKFGSQLFAETYAERETLRIWRTTSNTYNDPAAPYATTRVYRANAAIELLGETRPGAGYVYRPALVELPADVGAGSRWSGSGSANDVLDYRSEFRAEADNGCLDVTGEVRYLSKQGQPGPSVHLERTWCPGRGVVQATESQASVRTATSLATGPTPEIRGTTEPPLRWTDPDRWVPHAYNTISVDPTFGEGAMSGSPKSLAPVRTDSGLVVRATSSLNDLIAITPKTRTEWVSAWRGHVPGEILTLRAFGNVVIVATSTRQLLAYTDLGIRLWQLDLDEIAPAPPVRVIRPRPGRGRPGRGMVRLDIAGGVIVWQRSLGSDVPVVPGGGVRPGGGHGQRRHGHRAGRGHRRERRWTVDLEGKAAGFVGGTLVVLQDQTAHGLDPATGRRRWLRPFLGTFTELATFADRLVVATKSATVLLDERGR